MFKKSIHGKLLTAFWLFSLLIFFLNDAKAQTFSQIHSTLPKQDTLIKKNNLLKADTLVKADTLKVKAQAKDTTKNLNLEYKLVRHADDSIVQDLKSKKVYLYGNAEITYGNMDLKAAFITVNFNNNTVFAQGLKDSTGKIVGIPKFKQGEDVYDAKTIRYNFVTRKGIIHGVTTKQNNGFLHGKVVKRMPNNSFNVENGEFTTCDENPPHYAFRFHKARVIPGKLIATGPVYMEIEGIPTPLALPFGVFPNNPKRTSGLILPSYGESTSQGFYLQGGGYFWNINDKMTLKVSGDIYTGGSWSISPLLTYRKRYRYNGSLALTLGKVIISTKGAPDYSNTRSFHINWSLSQDPKTHPYGNFSANVNIMSRNYVRYTTVNTGTYLSNTFSSSVSYQRNFGNKVHLLASSNFTQNINTHQVSLDLPTITFSVDALYPFRKKNTIKKGLLDDLSISYNMDARNSLDGADSTIFTPEGLRKMQNGVNQQIPISLPIKLFKYFSLNNSVTINDYVYTSSIRRRWVSDTTQNSYGLPGQVETDTIPGFSNVLFYSLSSSLSTKIYGMLKFKKGPIRAIRHVITPSIGFSYTPDFSKGFWHYAARYRDYSDTTNNNPNGRLVTYSRFEGSLFGGAPLQKQENLNFSIMNSLEIKVPSRKDTVTGMKKIPLIQNFVIQGSYNFAADSLGMSPISLSGRTTLWKGLSIHYSGIIDPYAVDSSGNDINKTEWQVNRKLFRWKSSNWQMSFAYQLSPSTFKRKKTKETQAHSTNADSTMQRTERPTNGIQNPNQNVDWKIPWSLSLNYNFTYSNIKNYRNYIISAKKSLIQTLAFNGQLSLTKNWKFSFQSGWDFTNHQLSFTSVNIFRNLHCWEMSFSWIPLGPRKSWNFTLQIKASMLKDFKITKQKSFLENY